MFDHPLFSTLGAASDANEPEPTSLEAIEAGEGAPLESICLWDVRLGVRAPRGWPRCDCRRCAGLTSR